MGPGMDRFVNEIVRGGTGFGRLTGSDASVPRPLHLLERGPAP